MLAMIMTVFQSVLTGNRPKTKRLSQAQAQTFEEMQAQMFGKIEEKQAEVDEATKNLYDSVDVALFGGVVQMRRQLIKRVSNAKDEAA